MGNCSLLQGQVHDVCMTASHDVTLKIQYLTPAGQPIELDGGATVEGVIEGGGVSIDLAPLTTLDAPTGEVTLVIPAASTAAFDVTGLSAHWELSIVNLGARILLIDSDSTFIVKPRLSA